MTSELTQMGLVEKIKKLAGDIASREGCILYDLEFLEGGSRTLRVYIDREPEGASLDDCVNVSRGLNLALDVEDIIPGGHYDLEVSTPGLERRLTQGWHFERAIGKPIQVKYETSEGNRSIKGIVASLQDGSLQVEEGKKQHDIPLSHILKAKMVFDGADKKGPKGKKPLKKVPLKKR